MERYQNYLMYFIARYALFFIFEQKNSVYIAVKIEDNEQISKMQMRYVYKSREQLGAMYPHCVCDSPCTTVANSTLTKGHPNYYLFIGYPAYRPTPRLGNIVLISGPSFRMCSLVSGRTNSKISF